MTAYGHKRLCLACGDPSALELWQMEGWVALCVRCNQVAQRVDGQAGLTPKRLVEAIRRRI